MADANKQIFLSYASQDSEAALRVAAALREAGLIVWLDQSELRGGDAWDQNIRQQIKACALFVPIISANTVARSEGYFRLEWKLAIDRSHLMAPGKAFILPVVIDATGASDAAIPEKFREIHWTRLAAAESPDKFVAHVRRLIESPLQTTQVSSPEVARTSVRRKWLLPLAAAIAVLGIGVVWHQYQVTHATIIPYSAADAPQPGSELAKSIAVLPLTNSTGDPANEYFSDGISEELIAHLSDLGDLRVIARTSSFQFKSSHEGSKAIGEKLGVAYLLEGSVRRAADRVRINVALVNSLDGSNIWAESYDREFKDIFGVQSEIAAAVASRLKITLLSGPTHVASSAAPPSHDLDAYNALLQGNYYVSRNTEADFRKAIGFYREAIDHDEKYALAWAKLSVVSTHLVRLFTNATSEEGAKTMLDARRAAAIALRLDPQQSEAHRAQGLILVSFDFDLIAAGAEQLRALELAPKDPRPMIELGNLEAMQGRLPEAVALMRRATSVDPLSMSALCNLGIYLPPLGKYDEAEGYLRRAIDLQPQAAQTHQLLSIIKVLRGSPAEAIEIAKREPDPFWQTYALALAYQANGNQAEADAALKKLIDGDADDAGSQIASVYALRKEPDKVFEWLDHAWATKDSGASGIYYSPFILHFRNDPRFAAFARKIGLVRAPNPTNGA
jgi:TolB-like protein/Flp pilus assembly protein TadD